MCIQPVGVGLVFNDDYLLRLIVIGIGAIAGAWLRFFVTNFLRVVWPRRSYLPTMLINVLSAFLLGLLLPSVLATGEFRLVSSSFLFLGIGLLGSFSTFSSFAIDLLEELRRKAWAESFFLLVGSVVGGIIFAAIGYELANA
ncbi:fluoride efflux transporter FluC [Prochlorococcus sp. MIT 1300]|uniref:fluoride efflux transporter FluC n=1 Tax=Prochlorococcus sp. MIT 1300 TaxID=3096218 RepID=UPI002A756BD4|nr:CrcB family protein [Prochlorococcus sp. MIT 1300]